MARRSGLMLACLLGCTAEAESSAALEAPVVHEVERPEPILDGPMVELARETCEGISAIWTGIDPGGDYPIEYGFESLAFRFDVGPHAGRTIAFEPLGALYFSDWRRSIFSPDCRRVLLLQDRFGPYHVVAIDRLAEYLEGRAEPEATLLHCEGCTAAAVHYDASWVDADTIVYSAGACGTETLVRVDLPARSKCPTPAGGS